MVRVWMCALLSFCLVGCASTVSRESAETFDVVVYGATPGGVTAAVAAAREGATVALVEPLEIVGGIMSSGLSFSDSNQTDRRTLLGLFEEVHKRIEADYKARGIKLAYSVAVKDQSRWTYEPHVAQQVFEQMFAEAHVRVVLGSPLRKVDKRGARIASITVGSGHVISGKQFIDCTYEGDLMAAAG
jgi:flavin-dependent dehydrogenase